MLRDRSKQKGLLDVCGMGETVFNDGPRTGTARRRLGMPAKSLVADEEGRALRARRGKQDRLRAIQQGQTSNEVMSLHQNSLAGDLREVPGLHICFRRRMAQPCGWKTLQCAYLEA